MASDPTHIRIPVHLLPSDGRFGCGPAKIPTQAVTALASAGVTWLGTSHRRPPVKEVVSAIRSGLEELFNLPAGYEVLLGNGGTTAFWDAATFRLIDSRSQHLVFGEFSARFAQAAAAAPHIDLPDVVQAHYGSHPCAKPAESVDLYALTHNETSTGVAMPLVRPAGAEGLVAVDATSAAGGISFDPAQVDVYYFSPQKCFASDGGLWVAACSPAAVRRIESSAASGRWAPPSLDLALALVESRRNQTYNTPALATLFLFHHQLRWLLEEGGLEWSEQRCRTSSSILYQWAEASLFASPFVADPAMRSPVVGTIDMEASVDALAVSAALRANGIVDTESYRKLGRNQLRIGMFPAVLPDDVAALTACIDYVVGSLS